MGYEVILSYFVVFLSSVKCQDASVTSLPGLPLFFRFFQISVSSVNCKAFTFSAFATT